MKKIVSLLVVLFFSLTVFGKAPFIINIPVKDELTQHQIDVRFYAFANIDGEYHQIRKNISSRGVAHLYLDSIPEAGTVKVQLVVFDEELAEDGVHVKITDSPLYEEEWVDIIVPRGAKSGYEMPTVFMKRKRSKRLNEVTVTASKIMFYHRGDTLVYNADAFVLAEGSLLDDLLKQMPGVELKPNGQIFARGRYVDKLLLNGKDLFHNRQLMLENIAAYTIKEVTLYDKRGRESELLGRDAGDSSYVMDVRLKREYSQGWVLNLEGGYGTENRYLAKLFSLMFSDNVSVSVHGSANNLSDQNTPGQHDPAWSLSNMGKGQVERQAGGANYLAAGPMDKWELKGSVDVSYRSTDNRQNITRENFLPDGLSSFEYRSKQSVFNRLSVSTRHEFFFKLGKEATLTIKPSFNYDSDSEKSSSVSATFNREFSDWTPNALKNIDEIRNEEVKSSLVNRYMAENLIKAQSFKGDVSIRTDIKLGSDLLSIDGSGTLLSKPQSKFQRNMFETGLGLSNCEKSHLFYDNKPNNDWRAWGRITYKPQPTSWSKFEIWYMYSYSQKEFCSNVYRLNQLPDYNSSFSLSDVERYDYSSVFDPFPSYFMDDKRHSQILYLSIKCPHIKRVDFSFSARLNYTRRIYNYDRNNTHQRILCNDFLPNLTFNLLGWSRSKATRHELYWYFYKREIDPSTYISIPSDNPLIINAGNKDLKMPLVYQLEYKIRSNSSKNVLNIFSWNTEYVQRPISRFFDYDYETGVQTYQSRNSKFTFMTGAKYELFIPFGKTGFSLRSITEPKFYRRVDHAPYSSFIAKEDLQLAWQKNGYRVTAFGGAYYDKYVFTKQSYNDFSTWNCKAGVEAVMNLPMNWAISSDFTYYARRGYSDSRMNINDFIWNARVSKSILKGQLVFIADAYDILRQMSIFSYYVSSQSRIETVSNYIPSYVIFHIQWRFNKQPKTLLGK